MKPLQQYDNIIVLSPVRSGSKLIVRTIHSMLSQLNLEYKIFNPDTEDNIEGIISDSSRKIIHCHHQSFITKTTLSNCFIIAATRDIVDAALSRCYLEFRLRENSTSDYHYYITNKNKMRLISRICDLENFQRFYSDNLDYYSTLRSVLEHREHCYIDYSQTCNNLDILFRMVDGIIDETKLYIPLKESGTHKERFLNWDELCEYFKNHERNPYKVIYGSK